MEIGSITARGTIAVALALCAIGVASAGFVGCLYPLFWGFSPTDRDCLVLHFYDGRMRAFWFQGRSGEISVDQVGYQPLLTVQRVSSQSSDGLAEDDSWSGRVRIGNATRVDDFHIQWRVPMGSRAGGPARADTTYFRVPIWLPTLLLILYPISTVVRGPYLTRWRRRRNLCLHCGYSLAALTVLRCPECGTGF